MLLPVELEDSCMRSFKVIIFFIVNCSLIFLCSFFLKFGNPLYLQQKEAKSIYNLDTLVVGTSNGRLGINPRLFNEKLGWNAYSLATGNTSISDILYLVEDIHQKRASVKRIIFELDYGYWGRSENLGYINGYNMLFMGDFFRTRINYFFTALPNKCFINSFSNNPLTPGRIKNSWFVLKKLHNNDSDYGDILRGIYNQGITKKSLSVYDELGFWKGINYAENDRKNYHPIKFNENNINEIYPKRFHQLVKYCQENSIELVVLQTPVAPRQLIDENRGESHEWIKNLCNKENVKFIDFNYIKEGLLARNNNDYSDYYGHMMYSMAQRNTELLCEVLSTGNYDENFYSDYEQVLNNISVSGDSIK